MKLDRLQEKKNVVKMNIRFNNQLQPSISVFLLLASTTIILLFSACSSQTNAVKQDDFIHKVMDVFTSDNASLVGYGATYNTNYNTDCYNTDYCVSKMPTFKSSKNAYTANSLTTEVDFKAQNYTETSTQSKRAKTTHSTNQNNVSSTATQQYRSAQHEISNTPVNKAVAAASGEYNNSNSTYLSSNNLPLSTVLPTNQSTASNSNSNTFLDNNSLSITVDLTNADAMLAGTNPGDEPLEEPIPVGDGTMMLFTMLVVYCIYKWSCHIKKPRII